MFGSSYRHGEPLDRRSRQRTGVRSASAGNREGKEKGAPEHALRKRWQEKTELLSWIALAICAEWRGGRPRETGSPSSAAA
jgi:hypothetical protein